MPVLREDSFGEKTDLTGLIPAVKAWKETPVSVRSH